MSSENINIALLGLGGYGRSVIEFAIEPALREGKEVTDEMYSWIVNPPPMFEVDHFDVDPEYKAIEEKKYLENRDKSLKIVTLLKNEFYKFLCTSSSVYRKERNLLGGNVNALITGLSATIATQIGGLEVGVITSFITSFILVLTKVGKRVLCEYFKPSKN